MVSSSKEIEALLYRYAKLIDAGDLAGVAGLFAAGTFRSDGGPTRRGAAEVRDLLSRVVILHDGIPRTKHVTTNVTVEVDEGGDRATARSYFTVFQATELLPLQPIVAGRYHDAFERVDGRWRFTDRLIFIDLAGDLSAHLRR